MTKAELDQYLTALDALDARIEADPTEADRILIDSGIYTKEGHLAEEYA